MADLLKESKECLLKRDLKKSYEILSNIVQSGEKSKGDTTSNTLLADAYNERGQIRYLWVDFNEAVEDYSRAIELNNKHGIAYYNRGQVHYRMGRYKEAERDLLTALEIIPDFEDAKLNLKQVQEDIASERKFNT